MVGTERDRMHTKRNERLYERSGMQGQNRTEIPDDPRLRGSSPGRKDSRTMPRDPPMSQDILLMSPVPLPVIEEPPSDCGSVKGRKPIILGMPSKWTDEPRPSAPSLPSALLDVRCLSRSPLSAVSSLHEQ
jgi:hypothetical protein